MIETHREFVELVDKIQIAHRYNEITVIFKKEVLSVSDAQALVEKYQKGVKRGDK